MSDDDAFDHRLLKRAQDYGRLYPSVLARLRSAFESGNPAARQVATAMTLAIQRSDGQRERRLRDAHGLSPQESRVVLHLVEGGTVTTCAAAMGVAESTVRSHLKSVFAKTGCTRQSQLSALLQMSSKSPDFG
jgi:DNA-binding CsgD family transcriptional regulator